MQSPFLYFPRDLSLKLKTRIAYLLLTLFIAQVGCKQKSFLVQERIFHVSIPSSDQKWNVCQFLYEENGNEYFAYSSSNNRTQQK